jgi:hypothetical protein
MRTNVLFLLINVMDQRNNSYAIVGFIFILFLVFNLYRSRVNARAASPQDEQVNEVFSLDEQLVIAIPYDLYELTQGPHGFSYGHQAIDISAGKGAVIKSPINGFVTNIYIDDIYNPTLVIENDIFQVTLLHGVYTVQLGQRLSIGQPIGTESNLGYTEDMFGRPCKDRECGYHTHLNIFDKRLGENANPLELFGLE